MKLRVLPEAAARIDVARAWWRENRERAPQLLDEELIDALEQIQQAPGTGQRIPLRRGRAVRRILLPKMAFHRYYEVVGGDLLVLTLWGAVRGAPPTL